MALSRKWDVKTLWDILYKILIVISYYFLFRAPVKVTSSLRTSRSDIHSVKMLKFFVDSI